MHKKASHFYYLYEIIRLSKRYELSLHCTSVYFEIYFSQEYSETYIVDPCYVTQFKCDFRNNDFPKSNPNTD